MNSRSVSLLAVTIVAVVLGFSTVAMAGPPLICHPLAIGDAKTLPWVDLNYRKGSGSYDLKNLSQDTLAFLDSNASVLVHMETLRRATIYARQDPAVAKELITRLEARAANSAAGTALATFDLGYLAATYKQWMGEGEPNPAKGVDGYGLVKKAISLRRSDAEMEFAAALIAIFPDESDRDAHMEKAIAGAKFDPLLAQNVASFFNRTVAKKD